MNVNISKQMVVGALLLLVAMSGCTLLDTETPRGWPPAPNVPPGVGTTHGSGGHGCLLFGIQVTRPSGETIVLDVPTQTAKEHADDWPDAKLEITARSPWGTYENLFPEPRVVNADSELAYRFGRTDYDAEPEAWNGTIIPQMEAGRWYPWEVAGSVKSGASGLNGYGLLAGGESVVQGWVLIDANEKGGDDRLWFSGPDGEVETLHSFPVILPGGHHVGLGAVGECS